MVFNLEIDRNGDGNTCSLNLKCVWTQVFSINFSFDDSFSQWTKIPYYYFLFDSLMNLCYHSQIKEKKVFFLFLVTIFAFNIHYIFSFTYIYLFCVLFSFLFVYFFPFFAFVTFEQFSMAFVLILGWSNLHNMRALGMA